MTQTLLAAALLSFAPAVQPGLSSDGVEAGSGRSDPLPAGTLMNPPAGGAGRVHIESGSGLADFGPLIELIEATRGNLTEAEAESMIEEYQSTLSLQFGSGQRVHESGSGVESGSGSEVACPGPLDMIRGYDKRAESGSGLSPESGSGVEAESGSGPFGGRPNPFAAPGPQSGVSAPPPRPRPGSRLASGGMGGGFDPSELPSPTEAGPPPPPGDARVHALLVSLGWIAALVLGSFAGYFAGLSRGDDRRRKSLAPRQLDLAGEIAETADSLMAAADADEPGRYQACVERLRERVGRTAVLLDDRSAEAVRGFVAAAANEPVAERGAKLQSAYDGLVAALRKSVRGA